MYSPESHDTTQLIGLPGLNRLKRPHEHFIQPEGILIIKLLMRKDEKSRIN